MRDWRQILQWGAPTIAWCALVLIGLVLLLTFGPGHTSPISPTATRFLPVNTLILPGDLAHQGFTGRYIASPEGIQKGQTLSSRDVADRPALPANGGIELLLSIPAQESAIGEALNAGSKVQLCGKAPITFGTVAVQEVRRENYDPNARCSIIVQVPNSTVADLGARGLKDQTSAGELHLAKSCS